MVTPSFGAPGAVGDDVDDLVGLGLDLADQLGDLPGGGLGFLGELADLFGDDGEAAALFAGAGGLDRGVQREQVGLLGDPGDRLDDPADALRAGGELADGVRDLAGGVGDLADRVGGLLGRGDAVLGDRRVSWATCAASSARLGALCAARAASAAVARVVSTIRTWRSAPCATSVTAWAISPTARPASSDVAAICCEADDTVPADIETSPISELSASRLAVVGQDRRHRAVADRVDGVSDLAESRPWPGCRSAV